MALKKQQFAEGEIAIFDEACIYKRGEYWQFRIWLADEDKYFRQSLRTKDKAKAITDAEEMYEDIKYMKRKGKKIYSISIKQAVAMYIEDKAKYVGIDGANGIVEGRLGTIKAHKKNAVAEVKKLILQYNLTKGDIRGKAMKQLEG